MPMRRAALILIALSPRRALQGGCAGGRRWTGHAGLCRLHGRHGGAVRCRRRAIARPQPCGPPYMTAFDAWMGVSHLRLGPVEDDGRASGHRFLARPEGGGAARRSCAGRCRTGPGSTTPRRLPKSRWPAAACSRWNGCSTERWTVPRVCEATRAVARDLARMAAETEAGWTGGFAEALETAGNAGNTAFLSPVEARQALFTQLIAGLEFTADDRLGRPLGTFDRPRPERAEARASGRSVRNVRLSLAALERLAVALVPASPQTQAAFARAGKLADGLDDGALAGVEDPQTLAEGADPATGGGRGEGCGGGRDRTGAAGGCRASTQAMGIEMATRRGVLAGLAGHVAAADRMGRRGQARPTSRLRRMRAVSAGCTG